MTESYWVKKETIKSYVHFPLESNNKDFHNYNLANDFCLFIVFEYSFIRYNQEKDLK